MPLSHYLLVLEGNSPSPRSHRASSENGDHTILSAGGCSGWRRAYRFEETVLRRYLVTICRLLTATDCAVDTGSSNLAHFTCRSLTRQPQRMSTRAHAHTHTHTCVYAHMRTPTHTHAHTCTHTYTHTHTHTQTHTGTRTHTHTHLHAHTHTDTNTQAHTHTHTQTHTLTDTRTHI